MRHLLCSVSGPCLQSVRLWVTINMANRTNNSVASLKDVPFSCRSFKDKMAIKQLEPPRPDLNIKQVCRKGGKQYYRGFTPSWYSRKTWLAGCEVSNALYCYPCLLIHPCAKTDAAWTTTGVADMRNLSEKVKKHESSKRHLDSCMKLSAFGRDGIAVQLDERYRTNVRRHNDEVRKNRRILSRLIDSVKCCGAFELALRLRSKEESEVPSSSGMHGLVNIAASLDDLFDEHLRMGATFKDKPKTMQNELLECIASVIRERIMEEVKSARFVAIQVDETTDASARAQLVMVLRYIDGNYAVQERLFEFVPIVPTVSSSIADAVLKTLGRLFTGDDKCKLIAQTYDGASVMRGQKGDVQLQVRQEYENAHYLHCYAHQLNVIMLQAASHIPAVRVFVSDLEGICHFFTSSPKRMALLDQIVTQRLPTQSPKNWNFHSRFVGTVFEEKDYLVECFEAIRADSLFDSTTVREASAFLRMLQEESFHFFLWLFYQIMRHVDKLYQELQGRDLDAAAIKRARQVFSSSVEAIRDQNQNPLDFLKQEEAEIKGSTRGFSEEEKQKLTKQICNTILDHAEERFSFTSHLVGATLLEGQMFDRHRLIFPKEALCTTTKAYPMLNMEKLQTELSFIYESPDFRGCCGALPLYQVLQSYNLQETFSETLALLNILITTPMTTPEAERRFSTLKTVKTFLSNTMVQEHLNTLAMLSVERALIRNMPDFNQRVIDHFSRLEGRREKFQYK